MTKGPNMTETVSRFASLQRRLVKLFKRNRAPNIRLLPDHQMLIDKNIIPNPAFGRGGKSESYVPDVDGYQIYVAYRSPDEYAAATSTSQRMLGPSARPVAWDAGSMSLRVHQTSLKPEWHLLNAEGQIVTVKIDCGSSRVVEEVNAILVEAQVALFS
jgi:hypothetical protein